MCLCVGVGVRVKASAFISIFGFQMFDYVFILFDIHYIFFFFFWSGICGFYLSLIWTFLDIHLLKYFFGYNFFLFYLESSTCTFDHRFWMLFSVFKKIFSPFILVWIISINLTWNSHILSSAFLGYCKIK